MMLVAATPISNRNTYSTQASDSLTSLDSLMMVGLGDTLRIPDTPEQLRRSMAHSGGGAPAASTRSSIAAHPKPTCKLDCFLRAFSLTFTTSLSTFHFDSLFLFSFNLDSVLFLDDLLLHHLDVSFFSLFPFCFSFLFCC